MGFISYLVFIIIAIGFVGCVNHKGEWFIMMELVWGLIFGTFVGVIIGSLISDC